MKPRHTPRLGASSPGIREPLHHREDQNPLRNRALLRFGRVLASDIQLSRWNEIPNRIRLVRVICPFRTANRLGVEGTEMLNPTLLKTLLGGIAFLALVCAPQQALAQHGGHGGGGGGGFHGGGAGGGFHGGGGGGFHGGGSYGGFGGQRSAPMPGGSSRSGRMGGGSPPTAARGQSQAERRGSSSVPRADTSPGWHGFERSPNSGGAAANHEMAIADGQWHSFGSAHTATGLTLASNNHIAGNTTFTHGGWGGRGGWRGGWGGWRGGWGYPALGFGWGCWGCGWGFGFGWGIGWAPYWGPYWALDPYPYWDSLWWADPYFYSPPDYIYPYPY
jgi:hypothetical protein